jgi:hypothetical protein
VRRLAWSEGEPEVGPLIPEVPLLPLCADPAAPVSLLWPYIVPLLLPEEPLGPEVLPGELELPMPLEEPELPMPLDEPALPVPLEVSEVPEVPLGPSVEPEDPVLPLCDEPLEEPGDP